VRFKEFLNHRFITQIKNGFDLSAGNAVAEAKFVSHATSPRNGNTFQVRLTRANRHAPQRQPIFLICVICEICG
jgi:hypothetical protein